MVPGPGGPLLIGENATVARPHPIAHLFISPRHRLDEDLIEFDECRTQIGVDAGTGIFEFARADLIDKVGSNAEEYSSRAGQHGEYVDDIDNLVLGLQPLLDGLEQPRTRLLADEELLARVRENVGDS